MPAVYPFALAVGQHLRWPMTQPVFHLVAVAHLEPG